MLEVVLNESIKGGMKLAQNYSPDCMRGASVGFIGERPTEEEMAEYNKEFVEGSAMGGETQDVICIGFSLDIGDISGSIDGPERRSVFEQRMGGMMPYEREEVDDFFQTQCEDLRRLMTAETEKPIRVWIDHAPYSVCGYFYICDLLRKKECDLRVIELPKADYFFAHSMKYYGGWHEVPPGKLVEFLPLERSVTEEEKNYYADRWTVLKEENAPLRAVINGSVLSVPENFYDDLLLRNLPDKPFVMASFIGQILKRYPIGVSDNWYAVRIRKMIEEKHLQVVGIQDDLHPYGKVLRKV